MSHLPMVIRTILGIYDEDMEPTDLAAMGKKGPVTISFDAAARKIIVRDARRHGVLLSGTLDRYPIGGGVAGIALIAYTDEAGDPTRPLAGMGIAVIAVSAIQFSVIWLFAAWAEAWRQFQQPT